MNAATLALINRKIDQRAKQRAKLAQDIAKELHRNAPRTGVNINRFGEKRSSPGTAPALETGTLFAHIDQGLERIGQAHYRVPVNRESLEFGETLPNGAAVLPRPMGRLTLAELKARAR